MTGWLIGSRRWRALAVTMTTGIAIFVVAGLGAGFGSYLEYLGTLGGNTPTPLSLSGQTDIPWASYALLAGGILTSIAIGRRYPTTSWAIALLASVLGTPALYASGLVSTLALTAPLVGTGRQLRFDLRPTLAKGGAAPLAPQNTPLPEAH
jgi:hypothetical protein